MSVVAGVISSNQLKDGLHISSMLEPSKLERENSVPVRYSPSYDENVEV